MHVFAPHDSDFYRMVKNIVQEEEADEGSKSKISKTPLLIN